MKLVVFSICLNEAKTIGKVLDRIPSKIEGITKIEKLVIDDGSTDDTVKIAKKHGALIVSNKTQKRLAYSFQVAVDKVLELEADTVVNIDGDLQFDPKEIPLLVESIVAGKADFVAGDRFTDPKSGKRRKPENMPLSKYLGNKIGTFIVSKLSGQHFYDVTCGFRAYNRKALLNINLNTTYTYTQESFQTLAMKKIDIMQVPVSIKYFPGRRSRVVVSFISFLLTSAVNIIRSFRDYAPLSFFGLLGLTCFFISLITLLPTTVHFLITGSFSPYKFVAIVGVYFLSLSLIVWLFALLADIFGRVLNNQEKILYHLKELKYNRTSTGKSNPSQ